MSASGKTRRFVAMLRSARGQPAGPMVAQRPLFHYWAILAPHFRGVLLPPQNMPDGTTQWSWNQTSGAGGVSPAELGLVRQRLAVAQRLLADTLDDTPEPAAGATPLREVMKRMTEVVAALAVQPDPVLAGFVARTDHGVLLHSWGLAAPLVPRSPEADLELSGHVLVRGAPGSGYEVRLADGGGAILDRCTTEADGHFRFGKVAPGSYRVCAVSHSPGVRFAEKGEAVEVTTSSIAHLEIRGETTEPNAVTRSGGRSPQRRAYVIVTAGAILLALAATYFGSDKKSDAINRAPDPPESETNAAPLWATRSKGLGANEPAQRLSSARAEAQPKEPPVPPSERTPASGRETPPASALSRGAEVVADQRSSGLPAQQTDLPAGLGGLPDEASAPGAAGAGHSSGQAGGARGGGSAGGMQGSGTTASTGAAASQVPSQSPMKTATAGTMPPPAGSPTPSAPRGSPKPSKPTRRTPNPRAQSKDADRAEPFVEKGDESEEAPPDEPGAAAATDSTAPTSAPSSAAASDPGGSAPSPEAIPDPKSDARTTESIAESDDAQQPGPAENRAAEIGSPAPAASAEWMLRTVLRASAWQPRLLRDLIVPTLPTRPGQDDAMSELRSAVLAERQATLPRSFRDRRIATGVHLEFDAPADGALPIWKSDRGPLPLIAHVERTSAEIAWRDEAEGQFVLAAVDGHALAVVTFDRVTGLGVSSTAKITSWPWIGIECTPEEVGRFGWQTLGSASRPSTWTTDDHWMGDRGRRLDLRLTAETTETVVLELALVDAVTGWALKRKLEEQHKSSR